MQQDHTTSKINYNDDLHYVHQSKNARSRLLGRGHIVEYVAHINVSTTTIT